MKKLLAKILLIGLMVAMAVTFIWLQNSQAYTYEGEIDPAEINKWETIEIERYPLGFVYVLKKNPDPTHPIQLALLNVDISLNQIIAYAYNKNGKIFVYWLEIKNGQENYKKFDCQSLLGKIRI